MKTYLYSQQLPNAETQWTSPLTNCQLFTALWIMPCPEERRLTDGSI